MSTAGSSNVTLTQLSSEAKKLVKLPIYDGNRSQLEGWLAQVDNYFLLMGNDIPANKKVLLLAMSLKGEALAWLQPYISRVNDGRDKTAEEQAELNEVLGSVNYFKNRMRHMFGDD